MIRWLQSPWVASIIGMLLFWATTASLWEPKQVAARSHPTTAQRGPSWEFENPEVDQLIADLQQEKEALTRRSAELEALAQRLNAERQELEQSTRRVNALQMEFDSNVVHLRSAEVSNLKKLAKTYAAMTPETAAIILARMDEDILLRILVLMKESEAAPILSAMSEQGPGQASRVAKLSERLRLVLLDASTTAGR